MFPFYTPGNIGLKWVKTREDIDEIKANITMDWKSLTYISLQNKPVSLMFRTSIKSRIVIVLTKNILEAYSEPC